jgi:hypothetical protein
MKFGTTRGTDGTPLPNMAMQPPAGRRIASIYMTKTRPLQFTLALSRGGYSCVSSSEQIGILNAK